MYLSPNSDNGARLRSDRIKHQWKFTCVRFRKICEIYQHENIAPL